MSRVWFIDTSVLDHLLDVPGKSQTDSDEQKRIKGEFEERHKTGDTMILPIISVVETGNHICQLKDGHQRRSCADRFDRALRMIVARKAPWTLDEVQWDEDFIKQFLDGGTVGRSWVDLATEGKSGLGGGDLTLVVERDQYCERTGLSTDQVRIWTLDQGLQAHAGWSVLRSVDRLHDRRAGRRVETGWRIARDDLRRS